MMIVGLVGGCACSFAEVTSCTRYRVHKGSRVISGIHACAWRPHLLMCGEQAFLSSDLLSHITFHMLALCLPQRLRPTRKPTSASSCIRRVRPLLAVVPIV